jgi:hypothetical protein
MTLMRTRVVGHRQWLRGAGSSLVQMWTANGLLAVDSRGPSGSRPVKCRGGRRDIGFLDIRRVLGDNQHPSSPGVHTVARCTPRLPEHIAGPQ